MTVSTTSSSAHSPRTHCSQRCGMRRVRTMPFSAATAWHSVTRIRAGCKRSRMVGHRSSSSSRSCPKPQRRRPRPHRRPQHRSFDRSTKRRMRQRQVPAVMTRTSRRRQLRAQSCRCTVSPTRGQRSVQRWHLLVLRSQARHLLAPRRRCRLAVGDRRSESALSQPRHLVGSRHIAATRNVEDT